MRESKRGFPWPSYVDLMTNLFAIALVLFVVSYVLFKQKESEMVKMISEYKVMAEEYNKLQDIYKAVENINKDYFAYDELYKKHILTIKVKYPVGKYKIEDLIDMSKLQSIDSAGNEIVKTINRFNADGKLKNVKYLIVIEGQASKDGYNDDDYKNNDVLSYQRALALRDHWKIEKFNNIKNCELLVAGSGEGGIPRDTVKESNNQRFLVHIVPVISSKKSR